MKNGKRTATICFQNTDKEPISAPNSRGLVPVDTKTRTTLFCTNMGFYGWFTKFEAGLNLSTSNRPEKRELCDHDRDYIPLSSMLGPCLVLLETCSPASSLCPQSGEMA